MRNIRGQTTYLEETRCISVQAVREIFGRYVDEDAGGEGHFDGAVTQRDVEGGGCEDVVRFDEVGLAED